MKYNKSEIMKEAWKIVKHLGITISEGLKKAWARAKAPKEFELRIKNWFLKKNCRTERVLFAMSGACTVVRETEKAYLLACNGYQMWTPKSCTEMVETLESLARRGIKPIVK